VPLTGHCWTNGKTNWLAESCLSSLSCLLTVLNAAEPKPGFPTPKAIVSGQQMLTNHLPDWCHTGWQRSPCYLISFGRRVKKVSIECNWLCTCQ
jgi:hypothetical protein